MVLIRSLKPRVGIKEVRAIIIKEIALWSTVGQMFKRR